jgi:hypothetical protein
MLAELMARASVAQGLTLPPPAAPRPPRPYPPPLRPSFRIQYAGQLPPGCRPVLVFINTKSGPQAGAALRRRFLRALHPLQVAALAALPACLPDCPNMLACSLSSVHGAAGHAAASKVHAGWLLRGRYQGRASSRAPPAVLSCTALPHSRLAYPLAQVVELPRQAPDAALRLFAPAGARARILVVGGDGSGGGGGRLPAQGGDLA